MHRKFLKLLPSAKGESKPVIALNVDVRGFSKFSLEVESVDTALYVRKVYQAILGDYFPDADFFKPTGDGLLLVFDVEEGNNEELSEKASMAVERSMRLVDEFAALLVGDPWIYFRMPDRIGIGIARGAASRLVAGRTTLDYSGTVLNVASRLMDLARPGGIVVDQTFPIELLDEDIKKQFKKDDAVFVRSVAEKDPREVYYMEKWTTISPANRRPLDQIDWKEVRRDLTLAEFKTLSSWFIFDLEAEPIDPTRILVRLDYPPKAPKAGKSPEVVREMTAKPDEYRYEMTAGIPRMHVHIASLAKRVTASGVKGTWPVNFYIHYPT
jgi:class 3 adenylate cyclase